MTAKIKLNAASGGGSFSLQAPSSSANNRVFTLPDSSDGSVITSTSHKPIVNYAQTVKTDTFSQSNVAQGSPTGDAIFLDYAATASTNKLLVSCSLCVGASNVNGTYRLSCYFVIGGVIQSAFRGDTASGRTTVFISGSSPESYAMTNLAGSALISSPSTSSTRYSYRLIHGNDNPSNVYLNRTENDNDQSYMHRAVSTITIMEIAP